MLDHIEHKDCAGAIAQLDALASRWPDDAGRFDERVRRCQNGDAPRPARKLSAQDATPTVAKISDAIDVCFAHCTACAKSGPYKIVIAPAGFTQAQVLTSSNASLEACVIAAFDSLTFPVTDRGGVLRLTLTNPHA